MPQRHEEPPELTEADDEFLDAIWDRIGGEDRPPIDVAAPADDESTRRVYAFLNASPPRED